MHRAALSIAAIVSLAACHKSRPTPARIVAAPADEVAGDGAALSGPLTGSLVVGPRPIDLGVYLPVAPSPALVKEAKDATRKRLPDVPLADKSSAHNAPPLALVFVPSADSFSPPTLDSLQYFGRGLDADSAKAAAASKGIVVMSWQLDDDATHGRLRVAERLVADLAGAHGGFVWDDVTRQLFTPAAWASSRLEGWDGDLADMRRHSSIHYYATDAGKHRAITLGMAKFGLPDLVVHDVPVDDSNPMTTILDAVAQVLVEGATLAPGGELVLEIPSIRHPAARESLLAATGPGARRGGRIALAAVRSEEGDPDNRLVGLAFPSYAGATGAERQASAIRAIVGSVPDGFASAPGDDPELAAATARVQARLPAVAAAFRRGLAPGEGILVKAPFVTDPGSPATVEWMWIGVREWGDGSVRGELRNTPDYVKALRVGSRVEVKASSIADYIWRNADGSKKEGGESAEILLRRERGKR